jgi:glutamine amidotransferase
VTSRKAVLIPTGVANVASIAAALHRADLETRTASTTADILDADLVVLPGVGSFDAGREALARTGFDTALLARIADDRPTLAICLGFQLLLEGSDESRLGLPGLCVFEGRARRFPGDVRVPHLGWNLIEAPSDMRFVQSGAAAFAHSYRVPERPTACRSALCDYDSPFVAAVERGNLLACQFHPELSGPYGKALLERFCAQVRENVA